MLYYYHIIKVYLALYIQGKKKSSMCEGYNTRAYNILVYLSKIVMCKYNL